MSTLTIRGSLALSQFWPTGKSDADTAHLNVEAVYWNNKKSSALEYAVVHGKVTRPAIRNGKVTVQLQGIDSPELHYRPSALPTPSPQPPSPNPNPKPSTASIFGSRRLRLLPTPSETFTRTNRPRVGQQEGYSRLVPSSFSNSGNSALAMPIKMYSKKVNFTGPS